MKLLSKISFLSLLLSIQWLYPSTPNSVIAVISGGNLNNPCAVAITPNGTTAYVCSQNNNKVVIIDIATNTQTGTVTGSFNSPRAIAISPDGATAYVCNWANNTVSVIDLFTNTVSQNIDGAFDNPRAIAIAPNGTTAYACNSNTISVINLLTNTITDTIPVGSNPQAIAIAPNGLTAYVCNSNDNTLSIIDLVTNIVSQTMFVAAATPYAIAITPDGTIGYVCNLNSNNVRILCTNPLDPSYNRFIGTISDRTNTLQQPRAIAITPDNTLAYVCNSSSNTISIIDIATNTVISAAQNSSFANPLALAITPNGNKSYICSLNNNVSVMSVPLPINYIPLEPVTSITLSTSLNKFGVSTDYHNKIIWQPALDGGQVTAYKIYRNAGLTNLVATIDVSQLFVYVDHNLSANTSYTYYIVSQNIDGNISTPINASITTLS